MDISASPATYGTWLASLYLETMYDIFNSSIWTLNMSFRLYGCGILQAWLYFHWYPKDHWGVKTMVAVLVILETIQEATFFESTYRAFVLHPGDINALFTIAWEDSTQLLSEFLTAFVVQIYYLGFSIYTSDKKEKNAAPSTLTLALIQIGASIAQTTVTQLLGSLVKLKKTRGIITAQASAAALCDIVITILLLRTLDRKKSAIKSTNSMLNMSIVNVVNRGILFALCAFMYITLFWSSPRTFYFFLALVPHSKLYMNSALAMLNTRQHISQITRNEWHSVQMKTLVAGGKMDPTHPGIIHVSVNSETFYEKSDADNTQVGQKFIEGMI
ncbi:hypothetical protein BDQ17DRAFT_1408399 [Cyathus striatus]|nr:hypothetical protein BDQ17DRAFT_1408399 [Cyathus striatus]